MNRPINKKIPGKKTTFLPLKKEHMELAFWQVGRYFNSQFWMSNKYRVLDTDTGLMTSHEKDGIVVTWLDEMEGELVTYSESLIMTQAIVVRRCPECNSVLTRESEMLACVKCDYVKEWDGIEPVSWEWVERW